MRWPFVRGWHGIRKCDYVFYNPETGGQLEGPAGWALKKACRKAGLHDAGDGTLFAILLHRGLMGNGADLVTVKELLGHADN